MGINLGSGFESPDLQGEVVDFDEYRRWCDSLPEEVECEDKGFDLDLQDGEDCGYYGGEE
jgi:hypothetical protein